MGRKRIAADELSWMIFEQTREALGSHGAISVAIVPNGADSWSVLVSKKLEASNPAAVATVRRLERKLRTQYVLSA
jgi:hypothetical protein